MTTNGAPAPVITPAIDTDVLAHLDFDAAVSCEEGPPTAPCGLPAAFVARCKTCSFAWMVCEHHYAYYITLVLRMFGRVFCSNCLSCAKSVRDLVDFVPIGRG